jgi:hypothetical protein
VRGKIEWIYRSYKGMPYDSFDADPIRPKRAQLVFPGPDGTVIPSVDYQRMCMGFNDFNYLYTLEQLLAPGRDLVAGRTAARAGAEAFLHELESLIEDDLNRYLDGKAERWPFERYDAFRDEVIDHILNLSGDF